MMFYNLTNNLDLFVLFILICTDSFMSKGKFLYMRTDNNRCCMCHSLVQHNCFPLHMVGSLWEELLSLELNFWKKVYDVIITSTLSRFLLNFDTVVKFSRMVVWWTSRGGGVWYLVKAVDFRVEWCLVVLQGATRDPQVRSRKASSQKTAFGHGW